MRHKHASVQELLPLDDVTRDVLCLRGGDYRAVLEAGTVNFALKSEPEQEAILAGYRRFLNGLAYPLQVLVRIVPTDVEVYLAGLRDSRSARSGDIWRRLALDHEAFVRRLARERTLLDRRCYVVIPAGTGGASDRTQVAWPGRPAKRDADVTTLASARRTLTFRCSEVAQGLAAFGVPTRRLAAAELVALWRAALAGTPVTAGGLPPLASPVLTRPVEMTAPRTEAARA